VTRQEIEQAFADRNIDVQAWPWWIWIDMIVRATEKEESAH
jgi:hypothetical protein